MARIKTAGGERRNGSAQERARRKWSVAEKVRVVRELERSGAAVSEVARRHGAHMSMVKRWRAQYRAGEFGAHRPMSGGARLVPIRVTRDGPRSSRPAPDAAPAVSTAGAIEVQLASGQQVCIRGTVDAGMLRTVLEELSRS